MNGNTRTPPSLRQVYIALAWSPKVVELCIVDLSMPELSGFADGCDFITISSFNYNLPNVNLKVPKVACEKQNTRLGTSS